MDSIDGYDVNAKVGILIISIDKLNSEISDRII